MKVVRRSGRDNLRLRYIGPDGKWKEVSAETPKRREAERAALQLEQELAAGKLDTPDITWANFRSRYELEALPELSRSTRSLWTTSANWLEKLIAPQRLADVSKSAMSRLQAALREKGKPNSTIATYVRHIRAALGWAYDVDLLRDVPRVRMPRHQGGGKIMRSRPITGEEFDRLISKVSAVRPNDCQAFQHFLRGLWLSGLRVGELLALSWDSDATWAVVTDQKFPLIRILAAGQKNRRDQYAPMTPELWELIRHLPRVGMVFPLRGRGGRQMAVKTCVRIIGEIGRKANVVTEPTSKKCATSHDIGRRAFLTRMDGQLTGPELQKWARHASIETTMRYYHAKDAIELAKRVWPKGDHLGDPCPSEAKTNHNGVDVS